MQSRNIWISDELEFVYIHKPELALYYNQFPE
jgi:hypothetical protein